MLRVLQIVAAVLMLLLSLLFFVATFARDSAPYYLFHYDHQLGEAIDAAWWFDFCGPIACFAFEIAGLYILTYERPRVGFAKAVEGGEDVRVSED